jgi:hypothetical protein
MNSIESKPALDRLKKFFHRTKETPEMKMEKYLSTLAPVDRAQVEELLTFTQKLQEDVGDISIAVEAFGSTTRPPEKRHHPPKDIDIRILNSAPTNTLEREEAVQLISEAVLIFLTENKKDFTPSSHSWDRTFAKSTDGQLVEFIDYSNNDPSFEIKTPDGLPLHICISGIDRLPLKKHLRLEGVHKTGAVVLQQ